MKKIFKYLVSLVYRENGGWGYANISFTYEKKIVNAGEIAKISRKIAKEHNFESVVIMDLKLLK